MNTIGSIYLHNGTPLPTGWAVLQTCADCNGQFIASSATPAELADDGNTFVTHCPQCSSEEVP